MSVCAPPAAASASLRRAALPRRARCRASRLACAVASALPPPTAAGAVARAALLQRIATAPDRGVFGLPVRATSSPLYTLPGSDTVHALTVSVTPSGR